MRREIRMVPGTQDLEFELNLQQNPATDCGKFDYYDMFNSIQFEFVLADSEKDFYLTEQPVVDVRISSVAAEINRT